MGLTPGGNLAKLKAYILPFAVKTETCAYLLC